MFSEQQAHFTSLVFYAILAFAAWYVPLQAYARRIESRLQATSAPKDSRAKSILIAYLIWYVPTMALLVTATFLPSFCAIVVVVGALWCWLGHQRFAVNSPGS